jgi:hypothetical protein
LQFDAQAVELGDFSTMGSGSFAGGGSLSMAMSADAQTSVLQAPLQGTPDRVVVH